MPKEFDCKTCGTMVRSSMDDELIRATRYHRKAYHNERISKDEAAKMLQDVAA